MFSIRLLTVAALLTMASLSTLVQPLAAQQLNRRFGGTAHKYKASSWAGDDVGDENGELSRGGSGTQHPL